MLVVFPPIFVADTKLIDDNNFVAPLKAFFKYVCIQKFITRYPFVGISEKKQKKKHRVPDTYYVNNDRTNVIKFMKVTSNSTQCKKRRNANN